MIITTIYGLRDSGNFEKREGGVEDDNELTQWVEYWDKKPDGDVLVHRSAHVHLKNPGVFAEAIAGQF